MARILFVVPPMTGHIQPTLAVGDALTSRGHECAWVGHGEVLERVLPRDMRALTLGAAPDGGPWREELERIRDRAQEVRGLAGLKFLWEDVLIPLAHSMLPGVRAAVDEFEPDVVAVDQQAFAGAFAAREKGLPWATLATTSADRQRSLADLPRVLAWTEERLTQLQVDLGLEPLSSPENSLDCVLVFSTAALAGASDAPPTTTHFVGPALSERRPTVGFPTDQLAPGTRVLATLGTLNGERGGRFFQALAEGLGGMDLQVILAAPPDLGPFPANFIVRPFLPILDLLPHVSAVVCHGGHNTVCESLAFARPLVVAPIKDDQPVVAGQVVDCGAGLRVSFGRPRAAHLQQALGRVLNEPDFEQAATRVQASFHKAGGAARAADHLEALLS
ncbi:MAG: glycosyltransferase [Planctomycetota bacterium]|nr:glycosyltransferase [Planctomycetota bacterium]